MTGVATGQTLVTASTVWRGESFTRSIQVNVNIDGSIMLYDAGENVVSAVTLRTSKPEGADDSFITDIALRPGLQGLLGHYIADDKESVQIPVPRLQGSHWASHKI